MDRYSFTAADLHRLLFAGLPAHWIDLSITLQPGSVSPYRGLKADGRRAQSGAAPRRAA